MNKKILVITHSLSRTGAPKIATLIANGLSKLGYQVSLYNVNSSIKEDLLKIKSSSVKFYRYPSILSKGLNNNLKLLSPIRNILYRFLSPKWYLNKILIKEKPDIVLFNTIFNNYLLEIPALKKLVVIKYIHELSNITNQLTLKEKKHFINNRFQIWACSKKVGDSLNENFNKNINNIEVVYPFITKKKENSYTNDENSPNKIVISAGGVGMRKGTDLFIKIAKKVIEKRKDINFHWFGKDSLNLWPSLTEDLSEEERQRIIYKGEVINLPDYIKTASIMSIPSREDPFPIVGIEALREGVPLIGFDTVGCVSELEELKVSKVISFNDLDYYCTSILNSIDSWKEEVGKQCKEVSLKFDFNVQIEHIKNLLNKY